MISNDQGPKKIVCSIILQLQHQRLRTSQDDQFLKVLKHEAQGRTGVDQTVSAVKNDEGVKELIVPVNDARNLRPVFNVDGAAIQELFKFQDCIPDSSFVCTDQRMKALKRFTCAVIDHHINWIWM